jgi:hypothetical protein
MNFKKRKQAYEYVYVFGHPIAVEQDVIDGVAKYVGEISPIERIKKQRTTKWIRWMENGELRFALREK